MKKILKVAINSQTFRVVFDNNEIQDYHIEIPLASSMLMEFQYDNNFDDYFSKNIELQYDWVVVNEDDDFSWKSETDGSGNINYVTKSNNQKEYEKLIRNAELPIYMHRNVSVIMNKQQDIYNNAKKIMKSLFEDQNKKGFKNYSEAINANYLQQQII